MNTFDLVEQGDLVCDPFMGIGGAGVSSKKLNRRFIGVELDEEYFEIAKNRIEGIKYNTDLTEEEKGRY